MRSSVERSLSMLVHAARVSPPLREAVAEVEDELRRLQDEIERLRGCATHGTVDTATLCEREPRPIPACDCDQEPYQ